VTTIALNNSRYEWLKAHCTYKTRGDMDGPGHPVLRFSWDIWNEHPDVSPKEGLDAAIDAAMRRDNDHHRAQ
jgi:hypothetical protein